MPQSTQKIQYYSGRQLSQYYDHREYTFRKEPSRLSPEVNHIERVKVFPQEWAEYTPYKYDTDILKGPYY